jgi:hypothetical protein
VAAADSLRAGAVRVQDEEQNRLRSARNCGEEKKEH